MLILIVLCNGKLDDKYQYLFLVYATGNDNTASATDLRSLFGDLAKVGLSISSIQVVSPRNVCLMHVLVTHSSWRT